MKMKEIPVTIIDERPRNVQKQQGQQQQQMGSLQTQAQGELAFAHVAWAGGVPSFTQQRGFSSIADTAAGVATLTLTDAQNLTANGNVQVTCNLATFAVATVTITSTTVLVVRIWDAAGMALDDVPFWIRIMPVSPN